jgi:hypothetical protein
VSRRFDFRIILVSPDNFSDDSEMKRCVTEMKRWRDSEMKRGGESFTLDADGAPDETASY